MRRNFRVIEGGNPEPDALLDVVRTEQEFDAGVRQVDIDRIQRLIELPHYGEILKGIVHRIVGVARRAPEQQAQVNQDVRDVIASIADPEVTIVDQRLITKRNHVLGLFDELADFWESKAASLQGKAVDYPKNNSENSYGASKKE